MLYGISYMSLVYCGLIEADSARGNYSLLETKCEKWSRNVYKEKDL